MEHILEKAKLRKTIMEVQISQNNLQFASTRHTTALNIWVIVCFRNNEYFNIPCGTLGT